MGMDQTVKFASEAVPGWQNVRDLLARNGLTVQVRMIDGELAFPDELPAESWRELRVGTAQGMVTLRRESNRVLLVIWGNADSGLLQLWNALTWGFAVAGEGHILLPEGLLTADEFRRSAKLSDDWSIN